jgi:uncharacterized protein YbcI
MAGTDATSAGEKLAAISNGLVALHRKHYGKGPTSAKTYLVDSTVICVLRGGFTTVERTLAEQGRADAVLDIRRTFQEALEGEFRAVVEQSLGRKVLAYVSQAHTDPDFAVEIFMLEPSPEKVVAHHEQDLGPPAEDG